MSDDTDSKPIDPIELPEESKFSYVFNGLSNGMMVSAIIVLGKNVLKGNHSVDINSPFAKFITATGAVVGAVYGFHESKRIHQYRAAVSDELKKLRNEVNSHQEWHRQVAEKKPTPEVAQVR